jgi:hypothetical protein
MNATMPFNRIFASAITLGLAAGLILGCSNSVAPSTGNLATGATATLPVLITDAPSDQLVSFSLTLNTITLTDSAKKTTSILSTPTTIEITHLNGIQAPLLTATVPQDTYTSAAFTFSNPQITYINSSGAAVVASPVLATTSYTFTFPTAFTVGNTSTSLLVDLIASQSVTISGTTVTVSPVFSLRPVPPATAAPPMGQNGTGMQQTGTVVSSTATSLTIQPGQGPSFTVTTNSSTVLQGFTSLTSLTAGELVEVDFTVQSGGVYLASRIELEPAPPNAAQANLLTGTVLTIPSVRPVDLDFTMGVIQGVGPAGSTSAGAVVTVDTTPSTTFAITPQFVSLSGLPFTPTFTPANLTSGQAVGVITSGTLASPLSGSSVAATNVYLVPQTIDGTVTAVSTSGTYNTYTLTLASGSAFGSLSGATSITVYTGSATAGPVGVASPPAITVGSTVRFNGLIFNLGSGKFAMVAACSPDGKP